MDGIPAAVGPVVVIAAVVAPAAGEAYRVDMVIRDRDTAVEFMGACDSGRQAKTKGARCREKKATHGTLQR
jgi:hypothetical protein